MLYTVIICESFRNINYEDTCCVQGTVPYPLCTWPGNAFATRESGANMKFTATVAGSACLAVCTTSTATAFVVTRASIRQHQHAAVGGRLTSSKSPLGVRRTGRKATLGRRGGPSMMFDSLSESFTAITDLLKGQTTITESRCEPSVCVSLVAHYVACSVTVCGIAHAPYAQAEPCNLIGLPSCR